MSDIIEAASVPENPIVPVPLVLQSDFTKGSRTYNDRIDDLDRKLREEEGKAFVKYHELDHTVPTGVAIYGMDAEILKYLSGVRGKLRLQASFGIVGAIGGFCLLIVAAVIGAVDFSILFDLFTAKFSDRFGELPPDAVGLVALAALQGVLAMLTYKVVMNSSRSLAIAGWAGFSMVLIYGFALLLDQGFSNLAEATAATTARLGFNLSAVTGETPGLAPLQIFSVFALGIPLVLLPLLGGIFTALAMRMFSEAIQTSIKWSQFNNDYIQMLGHAWKAAKLRDERSRTTARQVEYVQESARERIDKASEQATNLLDLVTRARLAGHTSITVPGPGGTVITDMKFAEELAIQARRALDGYLDREFATWSNNPASNWRA